MDARALTDWLIREGLAGTDYGALITQLCERLVAGGIPLMRCNFSMRAYHPVFGAFAFRWHPGRDAQHIRYERGNSTDYGYDTSPLKVLMEGPENELRYDLRGLSAPYPFPIFEELCAAGVTEYLAIQTFFDTNESAPDGSFGLVSTWATGGTDGFTEADLNTIRSIVPPLALALKSNSNHTMAHDLMVTYLGADAGGRVLSGALGRGSVEGTEAVILYFDLAGFTKMSEALGPGIIEMLNAYFGAVVPAIEARGGNVLKFMGDGILAIFAKDSVPDTEMAAVDCLLDLERAVAEVSAARAADGLPTTTATMALHAGEVFYGNIGSATRLDFTVIGPAVNTAARIEAMCGAVDQPVVIGAQVARPLLERRDDLVSLGQYRLRGVADRQELFTLD
ncbi:MAG: adenylate/guanylate cyclase domain-containing protein [Pseudomonadota bacterium]